MEELIRVALGKQKVWQLIVRKEDDDVVTVHIRRTDDKFFEITLDTDGYDRPILTNFGIAKVAVVIDEEGNIATEPETITHPNGEKELQNRVIRASSDNPAYGNLPNGIASGANMLDAQRIRYRDGAVESTLAAANITPTRKTKTGYVPCEMVPLKDMDRTYDGPGKAAIFDAILTLLTKKELATLGRKLYLRILKKFK